MFAVRYDMQNMPLCMQNTPAICANEVIGSSAGLVPINALVLTDRAKLRIVPEARKHQMLCRSLWPVLALRGRCSRRGAAYGGRLFPFTSCASFLSCERSEVGACRCSKDFSIPAEWSYRLVQWRRGLLASRREFRPQR